jgi:hypothetical protein
MKQIIVSCMVATTVAFSACVGNVSGPDSTHGTLNVSVTNEALTQAAENGNPVVVSHVEARNLEDGSSVTLSNSNTTVDLGLVHQGVKFSIATADVPTGNYDLIRVTVDGQVLEANITPLFVDGGEAQEAIVDLSGRSTAASPDVAEEKPEHVHLQRGFSHSAHGGGGSSGPLMTYRNGGVLTTDKTMAIFWGTEWTTYSGDKITGIDQFFTNFGGTEYASTGDEYYDVVKGVGNQYVTSASTYLGHVIDASAAPARALSTLGAVTEACKITGNNPDPSALYLIYTSTGAGHVNYCAWHSWGTCSNGAPIQVAYMPNLDGIAGCDPGDTVTGHSQGLAALANVTAHETMETITDPRGAGWMDSSGGEDGDKCAWSFPPVTASNPKGVETFADGSTWLLQMEWSNAAYTAKTGALNLSGQPGCIY